MNLTLRRRLSGLTWGTGLIVAVIWGSFGRGGLEARGMGWAPPVNVSSLEVGQLTAIDVGLHDTVTAGQVVARLDPGPLVDEREVLSAELLASQEEQTNGALSEARRFAQGLESSMLQKATVSTRLLEDEALLLSLQEQLSIEQDLLEGGATSTQAVQSLEREMRVVQARITAGREALRIAGSAVDAAETRTTGAPGANQWEVVSVARQLEAIDARIKRMDLTTLIDGQVTAVYHTPGEVVPQGEPVLQIRRIATDEVVAWLPASASADLEAGADARVVRANGEVLQASLLSVGRGLQPLPASLLYDPQRAEFGVPVRVKVEGGELAPDEPVVLQL